MGDAAGPPEDIDRLRSRCAEEPRGSPPDHGKTRLRSDHRLPIKVSTRDLPVYRDPAVLLIDQLKQIYLDGELELIDTSRYFSKIMRKEFSVGLNLQTSGPDPDPILDLFYGCRSSLNWDGYCNPEVDKLIVQQSLEPDEAAQAAGLGDRTPARRGCCPADHLL